MFCPKCGTKNPNDGKFCRKCGTDIDLVSAAISGTSGRRRRRSEKHGSDGKVTIESAITKSFMGLGFLAVSIVLGLTGVAGGKTWCFWMLIPAFAMIGSGIAQFIRLRQNAEAARLSSLDTENSIHEKAQNALPPNQTEYVSPNDVGYSTGDLVPSSVIENTTRHLKTDSEGETMTLPNDLGDQ